MSLQFGVSLPQGGMMGLASINDPVEAYEAMTRVAQSADELGFSSVWLSDQFQTIPQPAQEILFECWASLAALARDTKRVRLGSLVTCPTYRNPALLAKMASTIDVLSHGRLTLGIGAGGWNERQDRAYGYEAFDAPARLQHLREAIQIMLSMWTQDEAVFEGEYYHVRGAINQPKGVQKPHIPLLIAGGGEKVTLKLVAQYADAYHIGGDVATVQHKLAILKQHCEALGRNYESIHCIASAFCSMGETYEQAMAKIPEAFLGFLRSVGMTTLIGSPATIREGLAALEAAGAQEVLLLFPNALQVDSLRLFAHEFI
ncbi:LLM class F420-dependent oxidoreductase [Ktedonosporobacter rubrisoli]|uniref:LLM class F420-dependent oxidoreductase n=1 Tax=Ktedonosporobacter rubrisoli TaxID=2509675 RepID=A0A4P6JZK3_KTERU|nr:LLM class F420-dependent oxidoreductase [Ktedonosporobacter rubrisoli]QBD81055.1 LLM class F420-dependent oxidoreductase [Ktedonosporobacter rubrisoli]